jgi:hypothetical protein
VISRVGSKYFHMSFLLSSVTEVNTPLAIMSHLFLASHSSTWFSLDA